MSAIHISAGGPSHTYIHKFHPNICVNRDILRYLDAEYFVTCDISFTRHYKKEIEEFGGQRVFANNASGGRITLDDIKSYDLFINTETHDGFSKTFRNFASGLNSGFAAVQFAIILGYDEIHLHGIDLVQTEKSHWHGGYGHSSRHVDERHNLYYHAFKEAINNSRIKFVSHSRISRLNGLPNVSTCIS